MNEIVSDFLVYLRAERALSPHTQNAYLADLEQYLEFCKIKKLSPLEVNLKDMRTFLARMRRMRLAPRSLARKLSTLRQFYKFLLREGQIKEDPSELLTVSLKPRKLPNVLSISEMRQLLEAPDITTEAGMRDRAIFELWYATGCRISELVNLKVADLDFEQKSAKFFGKGGRERLVPVHDVAINYCQRYQKVRHSWVQRTGLNDENVFFLNRRGKTFTRQTLWKIVKNYATQIGMSRKIWPHMIRHSFATHILQGGADLRAVQELLGHRSISTTEIYTHLDTQNLKDMQLKFHPRR